MTRILSRRSPVPTTSSSPKPPCREPRSLSHSSLVTSGPRRSSSTDCTADEVLLNGKEIAADTSQGNSRPAGRGDDSGLDCRQRAPLQPPPGNVAGAEHERGLGVGVLLADVVRHV